jgi:hypothetical protein
MAGNLFFRMTRLSKTEICKRGGGERRDLSSHGIAVKAENDIHILRMVQRRGLVWGNVI